MSFAGKSFTSTYHHNPYPAIDPTRAELSANGKVVLITGGGQGIGRATARAFARANASAIIIIGRTQQTLLETKAELEQISPATKVRAHVGDVSDASAIRTIFDSTKQEFGHIHVLVNNAGYLAASGPVAKQDPTDFWTSFETNVKGTFNVIQAFLGMASPNATILNMTTATVHVPVPGVQAYSSSKLAVLNLLDHVQHENAVLRVFHVQPGVVESAMTLKYGIPCEDDENFPAHFQVWLTTPEADFLKGKIAWANWDVEELKAKKDEIVEGHLLQMGLRGWEQHLF